MPMTRPKWALDYIKPAEATQTKDQMTIVPGLIGGAKRMMYTGAGADGQVQKDMPVMEDKTQYHEGEVVVPEKDVNQMGGPNKAMQRIQMMMRKKEGAPGVRGYATGGTPELLNEQGDPVATTWKSAGLQPPTTSGVAPMTPESNADLFKDTSTSGVAPMTPESNADLFKDTSTVTPVREKETGADTEATAGTRIATAPGDQNINNLTNINNPVNTPAETKPPTTTTTDLAAASAPYDRTINDMLNRYKQIASGDSDMAKRTAAAAFQQLDARLQTALISTAMRIANNPNLTEGAKRTMMAEQMRNAGIAQSELAGSLADSTMKMAVEAIGQTANLATAERMNQQAIEEKDYGRKMELKRGALLATKDAGDWTSYAKMAKDLYGVDIDVSGAKTEASLGIIADSNDYLASQIEPDGVVSIGDPGVRSAVQRIWEQDHAGQPMDETWATDYLAHMQQTMSPAWQFKNSIDQDAALGWFGGKTARLEGFKFGNLTGLEAFQNAMYAFHQGGAVSLDANGNFTFNKNSPVYQELLKTVGMGTAATTGTNSESSVSISQGTANSVSNAPAMPNPAAPLTITPGNYSAITTTPIGLQGFPDSMYLSTTGFVVDKDGKNMTIPGSNDQLFMMGDKKYVVDETGTNLLSDENNKLVAIETPGMDGGLFGQGFVKDSVNGDIYKLVGSEPPTPLIYQFSDYQDEVKTNPSIDKVPRLAALLRNDPTDTEAWQELKVVNGLYKDDGTTINNDIKFDTGANGTKTINTAVDTYNGFTKIPELNGARRLIAEAIYNEQARRYNDILAYFISSASTPAQIYSKRKELAKALDLMTWKNNFTANGGSANDLIVLK